MKILIALVLVCAVILLVSGVNYVDAINCPSPPGDWKFSYRTSDTSNPLMCSYILLNQYGLQINEEFTYLYYYDESGASTLIERECSLAGLVYMDGYNTRMYSSTHAMHSEYLQPEFELVAKELLTQAESENLGIRCDSLDKKSSEIPGETKEKPTLVPSTYFEFDIDTPTFATVNQGETVSVQVTISYLRGEREQVALSSTNWNNLGITTWFDDNPVLPTQTTTFFIKTSCSTPPDNYSFDVLGTSESSATSIDSVTVTVKPNPECGNVQNKQTTSYQSYENTQYGFSVNYPQSWEKKELLQKNPDEPNQISLVQLLSNDGSGYYMIGLVENDSTYKGLDGQQFLDKMKKEIITDECKLPKCKDVQFLSADVYTNKNGYKIYAVAFTSTLVLSDGSTMNPLAAYAFIPDGNNIWVLIGGFFSSETFEQISQEMNVIGESFTISDYKGAQTGKPQIITTPKNSYEWNERGNELYDQGNYQEALSSYDKALQFDPNVDVFWGNKALALNSLDRHDEALAAANNAIGINANYAWVWVEKGRAFLGLEKYDDALTSFERAIAIEPTNKYAWNNKALTLENLGSNEAALSAVDKALEIDPNFSDAHFRKGYILELMGQHEKALESYQADLKLDPTDKYALNNIGVILYKQGKYEEALEYYEKTLVVDPNYVKAQENKEDALRQIKSSQGGGCLIATATFGSELAPQVQFLREIRDNTVLSTASGASFMTEFNSFYYSFSPTVADWERENPVFKEAVKITITPLLSSLSLLQHVDIDSDSEMLVYGLGIILLNIGMYFVAPAIVILKLKPILRTKRN